MYFLNYLGNKMLFH